MSLLVACDEPEQKENNTIKDIDGNVYTSVVIGEQEWMVENLKVTHYRDGTAIPNVTSDRLWTITGNGAYCYFDNHISNGDIYGALYNGYAVTDSRNIAPDGWHVPTDAEWRELEMALGMSQSVAEAEGQNRGTNEGSKLAGNADLWGDGVLENDAEFGNSGFTALPGGHRETDGYDDYMGIFGFFWSAPDIGSTTLSYRRLHYNATGIRKDSASKVNGFSVRLVRN